MRTIAGRFQTVGAGVLMLAVTVAALALGRARRGARPSGAGVPSLTAPAAPPADRGPGAPGGNEPGEGGAEAGTGSDETGLDEQAQAQSTIEIAAPVPKAAPSKLAKSAATKSVSVGDNFYSPRSITIGVGDTVTWKNNGAAAHSATADDGSFDTGIFNGGQSRSETFTSAGTVPYFCTVHGTAQSGTIEVRSASGEGGGGGGGAGSSGATSEAAAVSSPGAAGSSSSLPATGLAVLALGAIGIALIGSGSVLRRFED